MSNCIVVTPGNRALYGALLERQFQQRRRLFVDELGWDIPRSDFAETDQYDRVDTTYILIEEAGELVGYARLLSTISSVQYGSCDFTYMVKDASDGKLPGIPDNIIDAGDVPVTPNVFEMTRVEARDKEALSQLFSTSNDYLVSMGATGTITFTRRNFARILSNLGYPTKIIGPSIIYGSKQYCVMTTALRATNGL